MAELIMLVGPPGCGKSYWTAENRNEHVVISSDDLIEAYAVSQGKTYDEVFDDYIREATKQCFAMFRAALARGADIIVDRTNMTKKSRARFLSLAGGDYRKRAVVFTAPFDVIVANIKDRPGKTISVGVVRHMLSTYQEPEPDEFDEVTSYNAWEARRHG